MTHKQRILYVLGSRPNFMKVAVLIAELRQRLPDIRHVIVDTGQDHDQSLWDLLRGKVGVSEPSYLLGVGAGGPAAQTAHIMERLERVIELERPDMMIVPGDSDLTLAATLAAVKLGVPTAQVESGLRSFDRKTPDEIDRVVADQLADLLFADSEEAVDNVLAQDIPEDRVHLVGNTMIDTLMFVESGFREVKAAQRFGLAAGHYLLVMLRGPALGNRPLFSDILDGLKAVSRELPVLFPRYEKQGRLLDGYPTRPAMQLVDGPVYLDLLSLEADAAGVLTDSGQAQAEASYLGVPCFTLRDATERSVTLHRGTNTLLGSNPSRIPDILSALEGGRPSTRLPPMWDGHASERVADVLEGSLAEPVEA